MKNKLIIYIIVAYFVLLSTVLVIQLAYDEPELTEPADISSEYKEKLKNTVVFFEESPVMLVDEVQMLLDKNDSYLVPIKKDDIIYVPIKALKNALYADVSWESEKRSATLRYNNRAVIFKEGSSSMRIIDNINDEEKRINGALEIINEKAYVPLEAIAKAFKKYLFFEDGLAVLSDKEISLSGNEKNELKEKVSVLISLDTQEKVKELIEMENMFFVNKDHFFSMFLEDSSVNKQESESLELLFEGKLCQNDDEGIYFYNNGFVNALYENEENQVEIFKLINMPADFKFKSMHLSGSKLVIIGNQKELSKDKLFEEDIYSSEETTEETTFEYEGDINSDSNKDMSFNVCVYVYDISDKNNVKKEHELFLQGDVLASSVYKDMLWVVSEKKAKELYDGKKYFEPAYFDTETMEEKSNIGFKKILRFPEAVSQNYLTVSGINLKESLKKPIVQSFFGGDNKVCIASGRLYIANVCDNDNEAKNGYSSIYCFELNENSVSYKSRCKLDGEVKDSDFIFERFEKPNVVTVYNEADTKKQFARLNALDIKNGKLEYNSCIENIGTGAKVKYVKNVKNNVFIVTEDSEKPLSVITEDILNPAQTEALKAFEKPKNVLEMNYFSKGRYLAFLKEQQKNEPLTGDGENLLNDVSEINKLAVMNFDNELGFKELFSYVIEEEANLMDILNSYFVFSADGTKAAFWVKLNEELDGNVLNISKVKVYNIGESGLTPFKEFEIPKNSGDINLMSFFNDKLYVVLDDFNNVMSFDIKF